MAFTDLGEFMPSKSAFVNPGEYEATQRNIALQKGTYMSEMDKSYAKIEEAARQFDLGLDLEQEKFDFTSKLQTGAFLESIREFDINTLLKEKELKLMKEGIKLKGDEFSHDSTFDWIGLGLELFAPSGKDGSGDSIIDSAIDTVSGWLD